MKIYVEKSLSDFEFWSGARDLANELTDDQFDQIEAILEDMYPDGCDETFINDLFWFEPETIREWLGITEDGEDMDEIVANMDRAHYHLSDGSLVEFDHDGTEVYGYYHFGNRTIYSSNYEWDGDEERIVELIIEELEDPDSVEGVGLLSDLNARYDSRKSFYGKAKIDESNDGTVLTLISYNTPVATFDRMTGELWVLGYYSATTARHIREFARQLGIELPKGSDIKGRYYI